MSNEIMNPSSLSFKKKRSKNTSYEQYELYLQFIENDFYFKTGSMTPNMPKDYIESKWNNLAQKLNAMDSGPQLEVSTWKKRFTNWKDKTRQKYRKIVSSKNQTGGGPMTTQTLTPLEERAIAAWGAIAVTGSKTIPEIGIPSGVGYSRM